VTAEDVKERITRGSIRAAPEHHHHHHDDDDDHHHDDHDDDEDPKTQKPRNGCQDGNLTLTHRE